MEVAARRKSMPSKMSTVFVGVFVGGEVLVDEGSIAQRIPFSTMEIASALLGS